MKITKILLTLFIVVLISSLIVLVVYFGSKTTEYVTCNPITGGSFDINYYDGDNRIQSEYVCVACSEESYADLFIPTKENKTFVGWYYDKKLTKKVETSSSKDIPYEEEYDKNNCLVGYKDINLYAKWSN